MVPLATCCIINYLPMIQCVLAADKSTMWRKSFIWSISSYGSCDLSLNVYRSHKQCWREHPCCQISRWKPSEYTARNETMRSKDMHILWIFNTVSEQFKQFKLLPTRISLIYPKSISKHFYMIHMCLGVFFFLLENTMRHDWKLLFCLVLHKQWKSF